MVVASGRRADAVEDVGTGRRGPVVVVEDGGALVTVVLGADVTDGDNRAAG